MKFFNWLFRRRNGYRRVWKWARSIGSDLSITDAVNPGSFEKIFILTVRRVYYENDLLGQVPLSGFGNSASSAAGAIIDIAKKNELFFADHGANFRKIKSRP